MSKTIINIYGPVCCGKTHNKERLKKFFRCDQVFDGMMQDLEIEEASGRILVLSHFSDIYPPEMSRRYKKIEPTMNIPFKEAMVLSEQFHQECDRLKRIIASVHLFLDKNCVKSNHEIRELVFSEWDKELIKEVEAEGGCQIP